MINLIVLLKNTLKDIPSLTSCLQPFGSQFLNQMLIGLSNPKYEELLIKIEKILQPEAQSATKSRSAFHRMFAVRTGINELLDTLRGYFSQYVDEIRGILKFKVKHKLPINNSLFKIMSIHFLLNIICHSG